MIKIVDVTHKTLENYALLLGFFDCLHIAHSKMLKMAKESFPTLSTAIFTFDNAPSEVLGGNDQSVLTFDERVEKAERLGFDCVIKAHFDEKFKDISPADFLEILFSNHNIKAVCCGFDYTFGKNAEGNKETLKNYCKKADISLLVLEKQSLYAGKISTSLIKEYLTEGNLSAANYLLGEPYFLTGTVVEGRKVGREIGFPTANIEIPNGKMPIKYGVYATHAYIDGLRYEGITNYGDRPTFLLSNVLTETYFKDFSGDLYGKKITLYFDEFLRSVQKFTSVDELVKRLKLDLERIK